MKSQTKIVAWALAGWLGCLVFAGVAFHQRNWVLAYRYRDYLREERLREREKERESVRIRADLYSVLNEPLKEPPKPWPEWLYNGE